MYNCDKGDCSSLFITTPKDYYICNRSSIWVCWYKTSSANTNSMQHHGHLNTYKTKAQPWFIHIHTPSWKRTNVNYIHWSVNICCQLILETLWEWYTTAIILQDMGSTESKKDEMHYDYICVFTYITRIKRITVFRSSGELYTIMCY